MKEILAWSLIGLFITGAIANKAVDSMDEISRTNWNFYRNWAVFYAFWVGIVLLIN